MHADDMQLVAEFAARNSEEAFTTLVQRHVNLVYSVALRRLNNVHEAEEVTQAVFLILAKKAPSLGAGTILSGWLYQTAQLTAGNFQRATWRRQQREQEAYMRFVQESEPDASWQRLSPLLEEAMTRLGNDERNAVVLRFFENRTVREVAIALGLQETAAQKRINRATDKLRKFFLRRGIPISAAALLAALASNSVQAAPDGLVASVAMSATLKGAAASGSTLTLIKTTLKTMAWTKMKTAAVVVGATLLAAGTGTVAVKAIQRSTESSIESYFVRMDSRHLETAPPVLILRPSKYANQGSYFTGGRQGVAMRRGTSFGQILFAAYGFTPEEMVLLAPMPRGQFDLLLTITNNSREALQAEIKKQFGLTARIETRDANVFLLKSTSPQPPGLKRSVTGAANSRWPVPGFAQFFGYKMSDPGKIDVVHELGLQLGAPVIDETGLTDAYDIELQWNPKLKADDLKVEIRRIMRERLGLELVPARRSIEMLVVEKSK